MLVCRHCGEKYGGGGGGSIGWAVDRDVTVLEDEDEASRICCCGFCWRTVSALPREKRLSELPPPALLELVVAVLDWRDGVRRPTGAAPGVRIMGMVSPWQLRREKRMGCCVCCFGRRHVQQYTATNEATTTNATKMEPTIRNGM